ncbi:type II toxin-antitoxin system PemK/MazF family toxin [Negadavirga shengliensis]|uniref:mRNA interferase n=1 Tax=Negadavirga shengliensis TaxID=1389218 RepID=A0ABV9T1R4_9BACT
MKQGEIWYADLNPTMDNGQAGFRPVVVISGNLLNKYLNVVIVIPLTSKVKNYKGNPILTPSKTNGLKEMSEMLIFHVRSVFKDRLVRKLGAVETEHLALVIKTLNDILRY